MAGGELAYFIAIIIFFILLLIIFIFISHSSSRGFKAFHLCRRRRRHRFCIDFSADRRNLSFN